MGPLRSEFRDRIGRSSDYLGENFGDRVISIVKIWIGVGWLVLVTELEGLLVAVWVKKMKRVPNLVTSLVLVLFHGGLAIQNFLLGKRSNF